ncbi:unnamed protein product [Blepharisma stoltei]|uniref:Uncharacterized protein n=1 Tax=Blepharisma stoltei TaxID=1481888 RepID=A0AAU9K4I1_9CILI|nr:unnamed protein product [Blepharisma stoltei]
MESSSESETISRGNEIVINLANTQYDVLEEVASSLGWETSEDPNDKECDVIWIDGALQPEQLSELKPFQRINHFPGMYAIARKDHLGKNLKTMKGMFPGEYDFFPSTWLIPRDLTDLRNQFIAKLDRTYICKPEASCQGKGIFLTRKLEDIPEHCVVQKYLSKPYLIDGLKFDLRLYVLVASCDPLRVYLHKEGLVRFATEPYIPPTASNLNEACMHLTNYAINKNNPKFIFNHGENDNFAGHKRSFSAFMKYLEQCGEDTNAMMKKVHDMIIKTLCMVQPLLSHLYRASHPSEPTSCICFQILGFDVFLDYKLRPHLLEVNHTPSFTTDTPLDSVVKQAVIGDALRMLGLSEGNRANYYLNQPCEFKNRTQKKIKEVRAMRDLLKAKSVQFRDNTDMKFKGGYELIYSGSDKYKQFMAAARDIWLSNATIRIKRPEITAPIVSPPLVKGKTKQTPKVKNDHIRRASLSPSKSNNSLQPKATLRGTIKFPALKADAGTFLRPRIFEFNETVNPHTILKGRRRYNYNI